MKVTTARLFNWVAALSTIANIVLSWVFVWCYPRGIILGTALTNTVSILGLLASCEPKEDINSWLILGVLPLAVLQWIGGILFHVAGHMLQEDDFAFKLGMSAGGIGVIAAGFSFISFSLSIKRNMNTSCPARFTNWVTILSILTNIVLGWVFVCCYPEKNIIGAASVNTLSILGIFALCICKSKKKIPSDIHSWLAVRFLPLGVLRLIGGILFFVAGHKLQEDDFAFKLGMSAGITGVIAAGSSFIATCYCYSYKPDL